MDLAGAHHEAIHSDHPAPQEEVREERLDALILSEEGIEKGSLEWGESSHSFPTVITRILDDTLISVHHGCRRAHHRHHGELANLWIPLHLHLAVGSFVSVVRRSSPP
jgi:hypothetical protein